MIAQLKKSHIRNPWVSTLLLASASGIMLILARWLYTGKAYYFFLIWNLFLAWLPLLISSGLHASKELPRSAGLVLIGAWLLLFPNAPYILTDLFHLRYTQGAPLWFDLIMILSFAWTGLMLALVSLQQVIVWMDRYVTPWVRTAGISLILILTGFGMYLGRYQRWNSWDLLTQPEGLMMDIADHFLHPMAHGKAWVFSACFAVFLGLAFVTFKMAGESWRLAGKQAG